MKIQILGAGCPKCAKLAEAAAAAANELGLDYELEKITDICQILNFGVIMTPALAINDEVRIAGKVPSMEELRVILKEPINKIALGQIEKNV